MNFSGRAHILSESESMSLGGPTGVEAQLKKEAQNVFCLVRTNYEAWRADAVQLFLHKFLLTFHFGQGKIADQYFVTRG